MSGLDALEVAKTGWEGLRGSEVVQSVEGLDEGFDAVFECTGVESCMQLSVMVSRLVLYEGFLLPPSICPLVSYRLPLQISAQHRRRSHSALSLFPSLLPFPILPLSCTLHPLPPPPPPPAVRPCPTDSSASQR